MSIYTINPNKSKTMNSRDYMMFSNINPNKKIYYPGATSIQYDTVFYRMQSHSNLMNLYRQNNKIEKTQFIVDQLYKDSIKIVVYTPPIDIKCGGIMVLHNFAKTINDFEYTNFKAYLYSYDHKTYVNDFCNNFYNPFLIDDKTIVIYPETIVGNPLGAKHVIRWILLDLGYEVPKNFYKYAWSPTDIVYHWEPSTIPNSRQLVNIWSNPSIKLTNNSKNRYKKCYAYKKNNDIPTAFHKKILKYHNDNDINIDKLSIEQSIEIFNQCDRFYCYDPNTFFSIMAPLCGCATVLHPLDGVSRSMYFSSRITCHKTSGFCYDAGIAYGNDPEEINKAKQTVDQAWKQYNTLCNLYRSTGSDFVQDMVNMINGKQLPNTVQNLYYDNEVRIRG